MVKRMLKWTCPPNPWLRWMVRMFSSVRIGRKVGKLDIDPFVTYPLFTTTGAGLLAGKNSQYVSPSHGNL